MAILEERRVHNFPCNSGACSSCSQRSLGPGQRGSDGDLREYDQDDDYDDDDDDDDDKDKDYRGYIANNLSGHTGHQPGPGAARPRPNLMLMIITVMMMMRRRMMRMRMMGKK